ncbi:MAG: hypothetical protein ACHQ53_15885 [Polyangiales bacterium]
MFALRIRLGLSLFSLCAAACGAKDSVGKDQGSSTSTKKSSGAAKTGDAGSAGKSASTKDAGGGDAAAATGASDAAEDPDCDMNGVWIARLTTFNRDTVFQAVQTASSWYYYEIEQHGRTVTIAHALDCGIQVSGSADVTINRATTTALLTRNDQAGRSGQFGKQTDHCVLTIDRFYSTRGIPRAVYLPKDTSSNPDLRTLTPDLPTAQMPAGNEDWDGDGHPGIAFNVAGLGSRHVVQRDWNEFYADDASPIALGASEFTARARFDNQEEILETSGALGGLLMAGSTPATSLNHRILFRRVARDASDPAVAALHVMEDVDTCYNVQAALPHDTASM